MITVLITRVSPSALHVLAHHVDYRTHPSRSWVVCDSFVDVPAQLTALEAARFAGRALCGWDAHEAASPEPFVVGEQLELFQCLPESHRPEAQSEAPLPRS